MMHYKTLTNKPKVMLHIIMPNQVSGPNIASKLIANSYLSDKYEFGFLIQKKLAGGRINISLIGEFIKQINEFKPDLIHLSGLQSAGFHAVIAARLSGRRNILLAIRGTSRDAVNISYKKKFLFSNFIEPITMMLSRNIYTVCDAMLRRTFVQRYSKRLLGTIHNSAPIINDVIQTKIDIRKELGIKSDTIIITIVGRIIYDKGVTFIAEAVKEIQQDNIAFIFIGDGPSLSYLNKELNSEIVKKKVFLLGKRTDVKSILVRCDIFLFATLHENLSNALLEACSLGLAVIATNVGGNPEVIKHDHNGILISPSSTDSIVNALLLLINSKDKRDIYGRNAIHTIQHNFSQDIILEKLKVVYSKLLNN